MVKIHNVIKTRARLIKNTSLTSTKSNTLIIALPIEKKLKKSKTKIEDKIDLFVF